MMAFASVISWARSRSPCPSTVQPGVEAFGYHQKMIQLPRSPPSDNVSPSWSEHENSGADVPTSNIYLSPLSFLPRFSGLLASVAIRTAEQALSKFARQIQCLPWGLLPKLSRQKQALRYLNAPTESHLPRTLREITLL